MGPTLIRNAIRLFVILIAWIVIRRSIVEVGAPVRAGGRAELLPWAGLIGGGMLLFLVVRSCVGVRI